MPWPLRAYSVSPAAHSLLCWLSHCDLCPHSLSSWVSLAMSAFLGLLLPVSCLHEAVQVPGQPSVALRIV